MRLVTIFLWGSVFCILLSTCKSNSNKEIQGATHEFTSMKEENHNQDSIIDFTFNDSFDFTPFIEKIKKIKEVKDFLTKNSEATIKLFKISQDSSNIDYEVKIGIDNKYRYQNVYTFNISAKTNKLFILDTLKDSLVEIE